MQCFVLLAIALVFVTFGKSLEPIHGVYALANYCAGLLSAVWGFAIPHNCSPTFGRNCSF